MSTTTDLRKAIKAEYPDLKFTVKTVSFSDLARGDCIFVESNYLESHQIFTRIKEIAKLYGAIAH